MLAIRTVAALLAITALAVVHAVTVADDRSRPKVVIVAHHAGNVYMVGSRQKGEAGNKPPQLPRGKVQEGERQRKTVPRELHEEIGTKHGDIKHISKPIAGHDNGKPTQTYVATLSRPPTRKPIDQRRVHVVPKAQVEKHLKDRPGMLEAYRKASISVPLSKNAMKKAGRGH